MSTKGTGEQGSAIDLSGRTGRWSGLVVAFLGILLGAATGLHAQGVRYDNIVLGPRGGPMASATVAVCSAAATTSATPCSPLATIYSDEALQQPMANPFQADSLGNYGFWAAPGHYVVQIYGTGVTTRVMNVFLPCDPSNCSMSNATFSSITAGTLNLTGNLTVNGRSVATEPKAGDAVMYVSPNGNDSADGLSWGSAKKTLYAAVSAIESQTMNSGYNGGTVYVADGVSCGGPVSGQGLWLYANASNPGTGWIHTVSALTVVGVGNTHWGASGMGGQVNLDCGSSTQPALELSGINLPLKFQNLIFTGIQGLDVVGNSSTVTFDNDTFAVNSAVATNGPAVLFGPNSFWFYFRHCVFQVNTNSSTVRDGSDATEALVVNPGTGSSTGLIYIDESEADSGDIKYYPGYTATSLYVNGLTTEGQADGKGAVWITDAPSTGVFNLRNIGVNDATTNPTPAVEVDSGSAQAVLVSGASGYGVNVVGPAKILSQYPSNLQNVTTDPYLVGQRGFIGHRLFGQTDAGRRLFSPSALPWANLVGGAPSQWQGLPTLTPGGSTTAGPSGANTAYDADNSTGSSAQSVTFIDQGGTSTSPGDYYIFGLWYRLKSGTLYGGNAGEVSFTCDSGSTISYIAGDGQYFGPGIGGSNGLDEWQYDWTVAKITGTVTSCEVKMFGYVNSGSDIEFYMPVAIHISAGTVSDNEAAEIGAHLANAAKGLTLPAEVSPEGLPFAFGGSGDNYYATLDHTALTADRVFTFPDGSGTICVSGLTISGCGGSGGGASLSTANTWTATQSFEPASGDAIDIFSSGASTIADWDSSGNIAVANALTNLSGTLNISSCSGCNLVIQAGSNAGVSFAGSYGPTMPSNTSAALYIPHSTEPIEWGSSDSYTGKLNPTTLTAARTYTLPDASGTIALSGADGVSAGTITLSSGSGSHTFGTAYSTAPVCTAADQTSAAAVKVTSTASAVSVSGTGSDVIAWVCAPAAN